MLVLCLLAWVPEQLSRIEQVVLAGLATLMIASQQSSLPLACALLVALVVLGYFIPARICALTSWPGVSFLASWPGVFRPSAHARRGADGRNASGHDGRGQQQPPICSLHSAYPAAYGAKPGHGTLIDHDALIGHGTFTSHGTCANPASCYRFERLRRWLLIAAPPALALLSLCTVNLAAHGRFAISPFGNIFLLARVIYDGPGMAVLRRDCPAANWRLCPFLDSFPPLSDEFLWTHDSPLNRAGGPKIVSREADGIIQAAVLADPVGEARAGLANTLVQVSNFASGDGLNPWPAQVSPTIERYFPAREQATYASARQQSGALSVPLLLSRIDAMVALSGVIACVLLLPVALRRRAPCAAFLLVVLLALPVSAAITGALSGPHDRYQARIMWLPPFVATVSCVALRRRSA